MANLWSPLALLASDDWSQSGIANAMKDEGQSRKRAPDGRCSDAGGESQYNITNHICKQDTSEVFRLQFHGILTSAEMINDSVRTWISG